MVATSEEIAKRLVAINLQILQLLLFQVAHIEARPWAEVVKEEDLDKYLNGEQKIPIHVVYHIAERAGAKDVFSWYLNRFNYFYNLNQGNIPRLEKFLSKIEARLCARIRRLRGA